MTTTSRQNNLILNQDWTRIYQTFKTADFKSYDFENLRRVIITYLRENYPEDFNDYIESSEYLALIDAVAFLGQSLAFRIDLASRENFIELAERKESVLRIAKMLSYNAKRNISAKGLLKFTTVTTTEDILDSNGRNLAQQLISWNDSTNSNWAEQFVLVLNAAMADNTEFGRSQGSEIIQGIPTEQYRFRTFGSDVPIYAFSKTVAARSMVFEVLSTVFKDREEIYEETPLPGNQLGFIYRNDSKGPASSNTGFFLMFKQGSLELADFSIAVPTTNERVSVDASNINNDDLWLFSLDAQGNQTDQWTQVSNLVGNNIAYNSVYKDVRNIFAVNTKENDRVDLIFADGVYGNLPQGTFRIYYRVSNGLSYTISPNEMRGINVTVPYVNKKGIQHYLTIGLALQYTVSNSSPTESIDSIRERAPAIYYTQNRMVTGEDYNLAPLSSSQDILKVKSINRTSSGISRNFEIIDASGKYSSVNIFADDGFIYRKDSDKLLTFKFNSRIDIINFIRQSFEPAISSTDAYNFYITKFDKILFPDKNIFWETLTADINLCTGFFKNPSDDLLRVAAYSTSSLKYVVPGAIVKFEAPEGKAFKDGEIVDLDLGDPNQSSRIWTKVIKIVGDGTNAGRGVLPNGLGPVSFNDTVPTGAILTRVVPKFVIDLPSATELEMINQIFQNRNFGLRYDLIDSTWKIVSAPNLDLTNDFSLAKAGDTSNSNQDASWMVSFVKEVNQYVVTIRTVEYAIGSKNQNRFYYDPNEKSYNRSVSTVTKDLVKLLGINTQINSKQNIGGDLVFEVDDTVKYEDGYESPTEIKVAFSDRDSDGVIDDPEAFDAVAGDDTVLNFIFFKETDGADGSRVFEITEDEIFVERTESLVNLNNYAEGSLIYFYDSNENKVKRVSSGNLVLASEYRGNKGRRDLKFQYVHNASVDRRIDPSSSNIIDIFLLTRSYDREFRKFLAGGLTKEPAAPTTEDLRISFGTNLNEIKTVSDEIIYHPVRYKVLFGKAAEDKLKAQFKVVKNPSKSINDNDLKVRIVNAIDQFFDIKNWDFGDRFYLSELTTYVINSVSPDVSNMVITPRQPDQSFGSLFEIQSRPDEIFVSGAVVDDIEIVESINAAEVRANPDTIVNET